jgi:hypothetical protein
MFLQNKFYVQAKYTYLYIQNVPIISVYNTDHIIFISLITTDYYMKAKKKLKHDFIEILASSTELT